MTFQEMNDLYTKQYKEPMTKLQAIKILSRAVLLALVGVFALGFLIKLSIFLFKLGYNLL